MNTMDPLSSLTYEANCARGSLRQCAERVLGILKTLQDLDGSGFDEAQREAISKAVDGCHATLGAIHVAEKAMDGMRDTLWDFPWRKEENE